MIKIAIFSDSHGDVDTMRGVVGSEKFDVAIHLGDHINDADKLSDEYPDIQMFKVLGNTDSQNEDEEWVKYAEIGGKRFMMTHGHTFIDNAENFFQAQQKMYMDSGNVDIVLYGHTHEPFINCCSGKWLMNPGRIGRSRKQGKLNPVYGVLEIDEAGVLHWQIAEVK